MEENQDSTGLPGSFRQSAETITPERVTLAIDSDVVAWLRSESPDWQQHVSGLLRFYMDTSLNRAASFNPDSFEPGELTEEPPHLELEFG